MSHCCMRRHSVSWAPGFRCSSHVTIHLRQGCAENGVYLGNTARGPVYSTCRHHSRSSSPHCLLRACHFFEHIQTQTTHPCPRLWMWRSNPGVINRKDVAWIEHAHAEKGRQISTAERRVPPTMLIVVRYPGFLSPTSGGNGVAEWSCRTCMRSSREQSQLASSFTLLLGGPEIFSLHDVVDFPLSAWHLRSKRTH
jgi:hypothetical protein